MDDLHVDSDLTAVIRDDQDADRAAARLESLLEAAPEVALVDDGQVVLDITRLGHGNNAAILQVKDAVLLEDRAEHGLNHDAGRRVRDEGRLLMELLGEEVNTKVAVLASGRRGRDADDLARAALQDEDVAKADVVAGDGHRVGRVRGLRGSLGAGLDDLLNAVGAFMGGNAVSQLVQLIVQPSTERVVVAWLTVE
jgi:hypothetical protein